MDNPQRPLSTQTLRLTLLATVLASSLAYITGSVVNVALPSLQSSFDAGAADVQWVITAYLLPLGALALLGGALGDHFGRRRIFIIGLMVFIVANLAAALAPSLTALLIARGFQGFAAALVSPNSLAIIAASFPGTARGKAVGTWAAAGAIGGAIAPVLGGWLVDIGSWRWALLIVLPPALAALAIAWKAVPESQADNEDAAPLDWIGAGLGTLALTAFVWALIALPTNGFADPIVLSVLAIGIVSTVGFILVERSKGAAAMMPLTMFATASFTGLSLMTYLLYAALAGFMVLLPYILIDAFQFKAVEAGAALLPFPLVMASLSRSMGALAGRLGARRLLILGPLLVAIGFAGMGMIPVEDFNYWRDVLPPLMFVALGMTVTVAPLTTAVMDSVGTEFVGVASGVNSAIARIAGLFATALIGLVLIKAAAGPEALIDRFHTAAFIGAALAVASSLSALLLCRPRVTDDAGSG
ncbi:MAG: MFS transporter [Alphaproteobacteria bacterium]